MGNWMSARPGKSWCSMVDEWLPRYFGRSVFAKSKNGQIALLVRARFTYSVSRIRRMGLSEKQTQPYACQQHSSSQDVEHRRLARTPYPARTLQHPLLRDGALGPYMYMPCAITCLGAKLTK
jgi:hypothetical protein